MSEVALQKDADRDRALPASSHLNAQLRWGADGKRDHGTRKPLENLANRGVVQSIVV